MAGRVGHRHDPAGQASAGASDAVPQPPFSPAAFRWACVTAPSTNVALQVEIPRLHPGNTVGHAFRHLTKSCAYINYSVGVSGGHAVWTRTSRFADARVARRPGEPGPVTPDPVGDDGDRRLWEATVARYHPPGRARPPVGQVHHRMRPEAPRAGPACPADGGGPGGGRLAGPILRAAGSGLHPRRKGIRRPGPPRRGPDPGGVHLREARRGRHGDGPTAGSTACGGHGSPPPPARTRGWSPSAAGKATCGTPSPGPTFTATLSLSVRAGRRGGVPAGPCRRDGTAPVPQALDDGDLVPHAGSGTRIRAGGSGAADDLKNASPSTP